MVIRLKKTMKVKKFCKIYLILVISVVILNIVAWNSTAFCDAYIKYIFPIWVNTYGRFMNLFSFSVGEIMLFLGVGLAALFVLMLPVAAVVKTIDLIRMRRERQIAASEVSIHQEQMRNAAGAVQTVPTQMCELVEPRRDGEGGKRMSGLSIRRLGKGYITFFVWLLLVVCLIMTLHCTILYHASTFSEKYFGESKTEYTLEDLVAVRNLVVQECNALSAQMDRDDQGWIVYDKDVRKVAVETMQQLGKTYDQLDGYYPYPKPLATSDFFSQQYMCGYYFPFSMEANYNDVMYIMNKPSTLCHELAHLRGYIFEDEANFISYLACIQSDDPVVQYSGYLSVLNYLDNDYYKSVGRNWEIYSTQPGILQQVHDDNIFLTQEEWDRIEDKAVLDTELVEEVSDAFTETALKANGVSDGMLSYSRVVKLLLQYYEREGLLDQ